MDLKKTIFASILLLASPAWANWADWPVATVDSFTMHQSQSARYLNVLTNDIGYHLKATSANAWSSKGGQVSAVGNSLYYRAPQNFAGDDTFWYVITDSVGRTNSAKVTVTIKPLDSPYPASQPDAVKVQKDKSIRIDVMKNDISSPSPVITEYSTWSQQGGRITEVDGHEVFGFPLKYRSQLKYTPPAGFVGTDIFWYRIKNSIYSDGDTSAAKVTVQVTEENSAGTYPVAKPDPITANVLCFRDPQNPYPYCRSQTLDVLHNDTGKNLKLSINSAWSLKGAKVKLIDGNQASGPRLAYTAKPFGGDGEDKVWYIIEDEVGRTNWGVVTLNVNTRN